VAQGEQGAKKCEGEFESLKAIYAVSPGFVPKPYAWGKYKNEEREAYFLLEEFRDILAQVRASQPGSRRLLILRICWQPADPSKLATRLADLHHRSVSPTGKFGFHVKTWHGEVAQHVDQWDESWAALFGRHLGHVMEIAKTILNWPEFAILCKLTLHKVVPRLLLPLQENGRVLKPSLVHGDCWDGNTALDARTSEAFVFDVCSFYGHNEYDTGNWRAPRHRLSDEAYIQCYKRALPVSEPAEDWGARNLLYSLTFNIGNLINIPGSQQREM